MSRTRKITYSAVGAAISSLCVALTNFGWLKVSLLMFAALCYYVVACKCGVLWGLADILISMLIAFFAFGLTPLSSAFLLTAFIFAPYSILSYFIKKLYYTKWKTALIRIAVMIAFANLSLVGVWFCAKWIFSGIVIDFAVTVGGYAVLAVIFTAFALVFDFLFNQLSIRLIKLIK